MAAIANLNNILVSKVKNISKIVRNFSSVAINICLVTKCATKKNNYRGHRLFSRTSVLESFGVRSKLSSEKCFSFYQTKLRNKQNSEI